MMRDVRPRKARRGKTGHVKLELGSDSDEEERPQGLARGRASWMPSARAHVNRVIPRQQVA